jgi:competence protein ComEA
LDLGNTVAQLSSRRALATLGLLAAAGLVLGYGVALAGRPKAVRVPAAAAPSGHRSGDSRPAPSGRAVMVHVGGAVSRPGLYRVEESARVDDAIRAAGGALPGADLDSINLAAHIRDGDKIAVPLRGQAVAAAASGTAPGAKPGGIVNLNSAGAAELDTLPGVGPALAQRIIAYRQEHGGFRSVRDLLKVPGIGPSKYAALEKAVAV